MNNNERGFSLVELMIAVAMGLILTAAIGTLYVANVNSFRKQDDDSRLQETARAALDTLGYHIRLAGFVDVATDQSAIQLLMNPSSSNMQYLAKQDASNHNDMLSLFFGSASQYHSGTNLIHALTGCEGLFATPTSPAMPLDLPWSCSTTAGPSSITLAYQVKPSSVSAPGTVRTAISYLDSLGAYNASTGQGGDCGGNDVSGASASPSGPLAINNFYIDSTNQRLMCRGNGDPGNPKPIAEGIEDMRILYGVSPATIVTTSPMDSYVGRYVTGPNVTDWSKVLSVRVCLQFISPAKNIVSTVTYTDCSGVAQTKIDGRNRQISRATFSLRNNVLTVPDTLP